MKTNHCIAVAVAAALLVSVQPALARVIEIYTFNGPSRKKPAASAAWNSDRFGTVSFSSVKTWTVGSQTWSDAVQATGCNKTDFNGYDTPSDKYLVDCRSNPDYPGDLFTWEAVNQYKADLCPDGWHVPTAEDFSTLDITLHGSDVGTWYYTDTAVVRNKYINTWGGSYGGACSGSGALNSQDLSADYWSQSEYSRVGYGLCLRFKSDGTVSPQGGNCMHFGLALRCVR